MSTSKKILMALAILVVFMGMSVLVYANGSKDVPKLDVIYDGNKLKVGQGSYTWKSRFKEKDFSVDSYAEVIGRSYPLTKVAPNSNLELIWDYQPDNITISGGYRKNHAPVLRNNIIKIPDDSGTQIYFVKGEWKEGTVTYVIVVQIEK